MEALNSEKTLMIGIGNSGRSDDGLGWAFVEAVEKANWFTGPTLLRYQLQVEDADLIRNYENVIFVDASAKDIPEGFKWEEVLPEDEFEYTTHQLSPGAVLHLCEFIYKRKPRAYLMSISAENWELGLELGRKAKKNLDASLDFFSKKIAIKNIETVKGS